MVYRDAIGCEHAHRPAIEREVHRRINPGPEALSVLADIEVGLRNATATVERLRAATGYGAAFEDATRRRV